MSRVLLLNGTLHGVVDWVDLAKREVGLYLNTRNGVMRCVILGPACEAAIQNGSAAKGKLVTSAGELSARCTNSSAEGAEAEILLFAHMLEFEPSKGIRINGSLHCNMKGVVMYWDPENVIVKSFINPGHRGRPYAATCSVYLRNWVQGFRNDDSRKEFLKRMHVGREYMCASRLEVSTYTTREGQVRPALHVLPLEFSFMS